MLLQGLRGSAKRYVKFLMASTAGYGQADDAIVPAADSSVHRVNGTAHACQKLAPVLGACEHHLHFMSHCEHHLLPFHGTVHIAIIPGSAEQCVYEEKVQAILKTFCRRLQIQERLTQQLADALHQHAGMQQISDL